MTILQELTEADAPALLALSGTSTDTAPAPMFEGWDNQPTWDNVGGGFDNRPSWDNWSKK